MTRDLLAYVGEAVRVQNLDHRPTQIVPAQILASPPPVRVLPPLRTRWVGFEHVSQYGLPGYPPPRGEEGPDESSKSIPSDAFSFSSI